VNANLALIPHLDEEFFDETEPAWSLRSWPELFGEDDDIALVLVLVLVLVGVSCSPISYALAKVPKDGEGGGRCGVKVEGAGKGKGETEEDGEDARLSMPKERKDDRNTPVVSLKSSLGVVVVTLLAPLVDTENEDEIGGEIMLCPSLSRVVLLDDVIGLNARRSKTISVTFFGEPLERVDPIVA